MSEIYQTTILEPISFSGIGLHSGKISNIKIYSANDNEGIIFKRIDLENNNLVEANFKNVTSAKLCTTLENNHGVRVSTVEHLLAAFYIAGIDNALVEINSEEVPIMDGSAKDFLDVFNKTQIKTLPSRKKYLKVTNKVELKDGNKTISIEPNQKSLEVDFQLNYENKIIGNQRNNIDFQKDKLDDVSNSRTFCLFEDIEKIKKIGLAKGGSLENAVVVHENKVLNEGGLRNKKEFVNHKILDLVGDFLLSGYRILGKVKCYQGGHELTNKFLRKILDTNNQKENVNINKFKILEKINTKTSPKLAVNA